MKINKQTRPNEIMRGAAPGGQYAIKSILCVTRRRSALVGIAATCKRQQKQAKESKPGKSWPRCSDDCEIDTHHFD